MPHVSDAGSLMRSVGHVAGSRNFNIYLYEPVQIDLQNADSVPGGGMNSPEPVTNFTPRAQMMLALARKEADRFHMNYVGSEHLLLGGIRLGQGTAVSALTRLGVSLDAARAEVEKLVPMRPEHVMPGNIPYTPRVRKVLFLAAKEARALKHSRVGTGHILLGLLIEGDGIAARVLKDLGVDSEKARKEIARQIGPGSVSDIAGGNLTPG